MAETVLFTAGATREVRYAEVLPQVEAVVAAEPDLIANLANVAAMLRETFGFFWVGFYRRAGEELILGPFQGPMACTRIALNRGVCGACATAGKTLVVPDVEQFPGHIACSSLSRSEIVVPIVQAGHTVLILDVDSDQLDDFGAADVQGLEAVMEIIRRHHYAG